MLCVDLMKFLALLIIFKSQTLWHCLQWTWTLEICHCSSVRLSSSWRGAGY